LCSSVPSDVYPLPLRDALPICAGHCGEMPTTAEAKTRRPWCNASMISRPVMLLPFPLLVLHLSQHDYAIFRTQPVEMGLHLGLEIGRHTSELQSRSDFVCRLLL